MYTKHGPWTLFAMALCYLLIAIVIAALLAYPVYRLADLEISFPRLVNRLGLGLLILGIFPARKLLGLSVAEMGFPASWQALAMQFAKGFLLGAVILGLVVLVLLGLDIRNPLPGESAEFGRLPGRLAGALGTGLIVAVVEESLFRGLLFGAASKHGTIGSALFVTAFFYAGLHFIGGRGEVPAADLQWSTGLELIPPALLQIFAPANLDSFLALFAVSLFLSAVLIETPRGIGYCIGLHAAWVFILKLTKRYTEVVPDGPLSFLVGSYDGVIGYLVAAWLLAITVVYSYRIRNKRRYGSTAAGE
jgi:uncharacterized protein